MVTNNRQALHHLQTWHTSLSGVLKELRYMAGSTENDFLAIGSSLQDVYLKTVNLSQTAGQLVDVATGEQISPLIERLHGIVDMMGTYLSENQLSGDSGAEVLASVDRLLQQVKRPLEGFKRMSKHLYMLEVSIKIESSYLGDMGSEFINLAMDIKKLSQQVKAKAGDLYDHQVLLTGLIQKNLSRLKTMQSSQTNELDRTLVGVAQNISELQEANNQFGSLGQQVASSSEENSEYLSNVVQSMQFHDIFRQQVEHVVEALATVLEACVLPSSLSVDEIDRQILESMGKVGDLCELQEAQLRFASDDFCEAVQTIVDNLRDISVRQKNLARAVVDNIGNERGKGSFIDQVRADMESSVAILEDCAGQNSATAATMHEVTTTVEQMSHYVAIIEEIGNEIISISLNARIKAVGTGNEGDSLSVLAEEIGHLSNDAVAQTETIARTLTEIHEATSSLSGDVHKLESSLAQKLAELEDKSGDVLSRLSRMGKELHQLMEQARKQADEVAKLIEKICTEIQIHRKIRQISDKSLKVIKEIYTQARRYAPASESFKDELQRMAASYTMESERRIHQAIFSRHGFTETADDAETEGGDSSEFGDNVDLF